MDADAVLGLTDAPRDEEGRSYERWCLSLDFCNAVWPKTLRSCCALSTLAPLYLVFSEPKVSVELFACVVKRYRAGLLWRRVCDYASMP